MCIVELALCLDSVKRRGGFYIIWIEDSKAISELLALVNQSVDNRLVSDAWRCNNANLLDIFQCPYTGTFTWPVILTYIVVITRLSAIGSSRHCHIKTITRRGHSEWIFSRIIASGYSDKPRGVVGNELADVIGCAIV